MREIEKVAYRDTPHLMKEPHALKSFRINTIMDSDLVILLADGQIVESGQPNKYINI